MNKSTNNFGVKEKVDIFAAYFTYDRRARLAFGGHFLCLHTLRNIQRLCTPVWNCNGTTAYQVKYSGKGEAVYLCLNAKNVLQNGNN